MKTHSRILPLTLLIAACLLPPVLADKVKVQNGANADFAHYKTYQWLPPRVLTKTGIVENHPMNPVLKEIVTRELAQKGLTETTDAADLQVQAFVLTDTTPQLEAVIIGLDPYTNWGTTIGTVGRYNREGTLGVNLIDRRTNKSAWVALGKSDIKTGTMSENEIRSKLDSLATKIFKKYPTKK
jgi:hypothetical protein